MASHFAVPTECTFADWQKMLESANLDVVLIATPNALHHQQAKAALERGIHVLLEKPMTLRYVEAQELVALAKAQNRHLAVALNPPFWAHCHAMRRAYQAGELGEWESASMVWTGTADYLFGRAPMPQNLHGVTPPSLYRADPLLNGGGYFIDGGTHLISELLWVTGLRVRRVSALMDTLPMDVRVSLSFEMENGAVASLTSLGDSRFSGRRVAHLFAGSRGTVSVRGFDFDTCIEAEGAETQRFREADLPKVATPIANLADAIQGKTALFSPAEHGAEVVRVVEAAYEAARSGSTVTLE
jgi:predicted dehydrogenase